MKAPTLRSGRGRAAIALAQLATLAGLVVLWQLGADNGTIDSFTFGRPSKIFDELQRLWGDGLVEVHVWETLKVLLLGQLLGTAVGVLLGATITFSQYAKAVLEPYLVFLNAMPRLILYPFFVVWLGFGLTPKFVTVALVVVTIAMLNTAAGLREVQGNLVDNVVALGAGRLALARDVYIPSLTVWVVSSSRVSAAYAFQATIAAQFVGANVGLGYLVNYGRQRFEVNLMYAAIVVILVVALTLNGLLGLVERRATRWMPNR